MNLASKIVFLQITLHVNTRENNFNVQEIYLQETYN